MCRRRKKPGTVANQPMRRLPPDLLAIYHRSNREKPLQVEGAREYRLGEEEGQGHVAHDHIPY